jgi:Mn2+/Fe2+ NRAMP family transporter
MAMLLQYLSGKLGIASRYSLPELVRMSLPMIPLVYYTSKTKFMGSLVNGKIIIALSLITVALILYFNSYLLTTLV